jgi:hypothetical protein
LFSPSLLIFVCASQKFCKSVISHIKTSYLQKDYDTEGPLSNRTFQRNLTTPEEDENYFY